MTQPAVIEVVEQYARLRRKALPPGWSEELGEAGGDGGPRALQALATAMDWPQASRIEGRPQTADFPLIVRDPDRGWKVVRQWIGEDELATVGEAAPLGWREDQAFYALHLPDPLAKERESAFKVFADAIRKRSRALLVAGLATVFANLLALATSLYAMQLYDRVIPLASFDTLIVLTAGVLFALLLDLALRSLRAILIEAEAQTIDREVSEFFFARAQAIRLDARPKGVGTMAAQIQGQEQIRQVMSASSLFVCADLPFAILFILVVAGIGGSIALVPLVSFPIALAMSFLLARIIRKGAERAHVTGLQKNGMLVEMIDGSETIKANNGGWQMLGRWNRLIRDVHHYEDPVKRASAVSSSLFSSLQQATYVAVMGYGAFLAATGQITTGGLLACSIIVGRITGPLVAQLPGLIVQWGYARSSLKALDSLLACPVETTSSRGGLRPTGIGGPITVSEVAFGYQPDQTAIEIDRLEIRPGEKVALVGGVGAGKSTLLKLMAGLYLPQRGAILLDGYDIAQLAEDALRREVGYLSQSARPVRGTLRESLTMGLGHLADEDLIATARATGLADLFGERMAGLDARIEEGGLGLSGGQKALVGLNRMIHQKPRIWLLDEPTAALDAASEQLVLDAIEKCLRKDDILILATHKIGLVERLSRVVMMARGRVIGSEPADEFLSRLRKGSPRAAAVAGTRREEGDAAGTVTTRIRRGRAS